MAASDKRKDKKVRRQYEPNEKQVRRTEDPDSYFPFNPSWNFNNADTERWAFTQDAVGDRFWTEILPRLRGLETQTWRQILVIASKQNHSIDVEHLNKVARDRLDERNIEAESIMSLRVTATHRLYGYMVGSVFNLLWYDDNHGDNDTCVCRSIQRHT